jgi:glutamate decarboxylase
MYEYLYFFLLQVYDFLVSKLEATGHFEILSNGDLPVVAFRLKGERQYDEFDIMHRLKEHRFMLPAYKMAADLGNVSLLRACIRQGFDMEMAESLVESLGHVIKWLDAHGAPPKKEGEGGMASGGGGKHGVSEE